jgi:hypothetical protein
MGPDTISSSFSVDDNRSTCSHQWRLMEMETANLHLPLVSIEAI